MMWSYAPINVPNDFINVLKITLNQLSINFYISWDANIAAQKRKTYGDKSESRIQV